MGNMMEKEIALLTGGEGKIVYMDLFGLTNMEDGY